MGTVAFILSKATSQFIRLGDYSPPLQSYLKFAGQIIFSEFLPPEMDGFVSLYIKAKY